MAFFTNPYTNGGWGFNTGYAGPTQTPPANNGWTYAPGGAAPSGPSAGVTGWYNPATGGAAKQTGGGTTTGTWGAPGASPGTNQYTPDFNGGLLSGPGYGEQFYTNNAYRFSQPTQAQQYWNGISGQFTQPYDSSAFTGAYNNFVGGMSNPGQGVTSAYNYAGQLGAGPGMGETAAAQAAGYFGNVGSGEQYINGLMNSGYFSQPGAAEDYYNQNRTFFGTSGQGENYVSQNLGQLQGPGAAETNYDDARRALAGINYGQQGINLFDKTQGQAQNALSYFKDVRPDAMTNYIASDYDQNWRQPLQDKSYSEQLYDSGQGNALLAPYARAQQLQQRSIDDQMAARGLYGSGAAIRAQEELAADIGAQDAQARIGLANQADQQRLARAGTALNYLQAGSQDILNRRQLGLNAASAADQSMQGLMGLGLQAFGQASQEGLGKVGLQNTAASNAENALISRVGTAGNLALGAQNAALQRVMGGGEMANNAQAAGLARTLGGVNTAAQGQQLGAQRNMNLLNAGQVGQQLQNQRLMDAGQLGLNADQLNQQRMMDLLSGAQVRNNVDLNTYNTNQNTMRSAFDINSQLDNQQYSRLMDQYTMASGAQNLMENRLRNGQSDMLAAANAQSQAVLGALDAADRERFQAQISDIEAQMQSGNISAAYAQQQIDQLLQSATLLAKSKGGK